jgi:hypothetical protein
MHNGLSFQLTCKDVNLQFFALWSIARDNRVLGIDGLNIPESDFRPREAEFFIFFFGPITRGCDR